MSQQITHIAAALESMQSAIETPLACGNPSRASNAAAMDVLSKSYIMEGERTVHASVTGEGETGGALDDVEIY